MGGQSALRHRLPRRPHRAPVADRLSRRAVRVHRRRRSENWAGPRSLHPQDTVAPSVSRGAAELAAFLLGGTPRQKIGSVPRFESAVGLTGVEKIIHLELKRHGAWLGRVRCRYCPRAHQEKYDLREIGSVTGFIAIVEARLRAMGWPVTRSVGDSLMSTDR